MNKILLISGVALLLSVTSSCEDTLTEKPESSYDSRLLFSTIQGADMALNGAYATLSAPQHYGQYEMSVAGSDDISFMTSGGFDNGLRDANCYRHTRSNSVLDELWNRKYDGINRVNHIVYQLQQMEAYKNKDKRLLAIEAEARFLRAMLGFDIIRYWGDAPFKTEYTGTYDNAYQPKVSRDEIFDKIIADLEIAKKQLDWATASHKPERPSQGAVRALLMRIYLHRAGYYFPSTATQGSALIRPEDGIRQEYFKKITDEFEAFANEGGNFHKLCPSGYEQYWKNFCEKQQDPFESLYEIAFFTPDGNPAGSSLWGTYMGPLTDEKSIYNRANAFFRVVSNWAKDYYDMNDVRKGINVCNYKIDKDGNRVSENDFTFYPGKWRREWMSNAPKDRNNADVNFSYIRYADVLLMAAEAYNEQGNTTMAKSLINEIRTRANAKTWTTDQDFTDNYVTDKWNVINNLISIGDEQGKVRRALYWERGFELCYEGLRRFDLMRWGIIREVIPEVFSPNKANKPINIYSAGSYFKAGMSELYPIPKKEMDVNFKITANNPGY